MNLFFFSSRRRHTRWTGDWSSDVCSSDLSLRRTKLRSLDGEVINIHNSQIAAVRVLPGGVKELDVELVASDRDAAERLVLDVAALMPTSPTTFVQRPEIHQIDELAPGLVRL